MNKKMKRLPSDYVYTYSGRAIYTPDFLISDITDVDIAFGLAGIYRYGGQTRISVLRHSFAVASFFINHPGRFRWALLHDAAEVYMMDIPVPHKHYVTEEWHEDYARVESCIGEKYCPDRTGEDIVCVANVDKSVVPYEMTKAGRMGNGSFYRFPMPALCPMTLREFEEMDLRYQWHLQESDLIRKFLDLLNFAQE